MGRALPASIVLAIGLVAACSNGSKGAGSNLAFCDCQAASGAGCGNAMTVPSCDISAIRGTLATSLSIGQPVDDCSNPPESG